MKPLPSRLVPWIASILTRASPRILPRRARVPGVSCTVTLNSTGILSLPLPGPSPLPSPVRTSCRPAPLPPSPANTSCPFPGTSSSRWCEVLTRLIALAGAPVELAEAEVAVGDERTHPEVVRERRRLAVHFVPSGSPRPWPEGRGGAELARAAPKHPPAP